MELKRILARDIRAANEKAVAQYGPGVLVISSSQVHGMTELIVAVDIPPLSAEDVESQFNPHPTSVSCEPGGDNFATVMGQTLARPARAVPDSQASHASQTMPGVSDNPPKAAQPLIDAHDTLRGREIVALVREELAALRREFQLSQQLAAWQGGASWPSALTPLRDALNDAPIPLTLRTLLIDSVRDFDNLPQALHALQNQLLHAIAQDKADAPLQGVHVLAGPSGGGKSLMVARLAQAAALLHGSDAVLVISYQDQRAGAWHQAQLLNAQSGVGTCRAASVGTLQLLLEQHATRQLILIDTPGVQMNERLAELHSLPGTLSYHAVVSAEASAATWQRMFVQPENMWDSLMLSKLDEATQPWALLQFLTERSVKLSVASRGDTLADLVQDVAPGELVQRALNHLKLAASTLSHIATRPSTVTTGLAHE